MDDPRKALHAMSLVKRGMEESEVKEIVYGLINDTPYDKYLLKYASYDVLLHILNNYDMKLFIKALENGANINAFTSHRTDTLLEHVISSNYLRTKIMLQYGAKILSRYIFEIFDMKTYNLIMSYSNSEVPFKKFDIVQHIEKSVDEIEPELLVTLKNRAETMSYRSSVVPPGEFDIVQHIENSVNEMNLLLNTRV